MRAGYEASLAGYQRYADLLATLVTPEPLAAYAASIQHAENSPDVPLVSAPPLAFDTRP